MSAKEFFKRFVWGTLFPAILYVVIGVMIAAMYRPIFRLESTRYAFEYAVGVLALFACGFTIAYYFCGHSDNIIFLLSGIGSGSAAIWLFVPDFFSASVVPIAFGIVMILRAGACVLDAVYERVKGGKGWIVGLVIALAFVAAGVVSCVNPFEKNMDCWIFLGVLLVAEAVFEIVLILRGGLFRPEEVLKFRPVKKKDNSDLKK